MGIRREIKSLREEIKQLEKALTQDYAQQVLELKELKENISNIKLTVTKTRIFLDENGEKCLNLQYSIPEVVVKFDENKKPIYNALFYSINRLDLLGSKDSTNIRKALEKISLKK